MGNAKSQQVAIEPEDPKKPEKYNPEAKAEKFNPKAKPEKFNPEAKPAPLQHTRSDAAERVLENLHNWEGISKEANLNEQSVSPRNKLANLQKGVFLNDKRQKYWVDKMGKNCFMLYGKHFHIVWGDNNDHWHWHRLHEPASDNGVEVAELVKVSWLEMLGGFDTTKLSPETSYEVSFVIKMTSESYGFQCYPVSFSFHLPDGSWLGKKMDLSTLQPRDVWVEIPVGKFRTSPRNLGDMKITMCETCQLWKKGLLIKGVKIRPKV